METIVKQRLEEFITKNIAPKELAKYLRRFEHETIKNGAKCRKRRYLL